MTAKPIFICDNASYNYKVYLNNQSFFVPATVKHSFSNLIGIWNAGCVDINYTRHNIEITETESQIMYFNPECVKLIFTLTLFENNNFYVESAND